MDNKTDNTIGILLAAGLGERFMNSSQSQKKVKFIEKSEEFITSTPKQLYNLDGRPIFIHSLEKMCQSMDRVILVTNYEIYETIVHYVNFYIIHEYQTKINIIINVPTITTTMNKKEVKKTERIDSILQGINYVRDIYPLSKWIIIHDAVRPFLETNHFTELINEVNKKNVLYAQYTIKLTNGLLKTFTNPTNSILQYDVLNRDEFVELVTPLCIDLQTAIKISDDHFKKDKLDKATSTEFIPFISPSNISFIEGHWSFLRKITTYKDL
jgi:2-C-methyl-D-erythritol 4-phosphate cytidylyltransferase